MPKVSEPKQEVKFEMVDIDLLKEDESNPNMMTREQMANVKANIEQFGFLVPLVINDNNEVADGEHRKQIAKELGYKQVPCIRSSKLNEDVFRRIARQGLNKIRGEHAIVKDISELKIIMESQIKGAANILQKVSGIGQATYEDMQRILKTGGIPEIKGQFETFIGDDGRYQDKVQTSRKAETYLTNAIKQIVLYFSADQYQIMVEKLDIMGRELGASNNTDIFMKLVEFYEEHRAAK